MNEWWAPINTLLGIIVVVVLLNKGGFWDWLEDYADRFFMAYRTFGREE